MSLLIERPKLKIIPIEVPEKNILKSINFYLVESNNNLYLIDAGLDNAIYWEHLETALKQHGYVLSDLTAILLTHHHFDHLGLVQRIITLHNIPVYIHPYAIPKLDGDAEFVYMRYIFIKEIMKKLNCGQYGDEQVKAMYERQKKEQHVAKNWNLKEITQPKIFDFNIVHIPGHAPDQIAFYLQEEEIIFLGDLLINHLRSNALVEPEENGSRIKALIQHKHSLEKIITLNPKIALSGHGSVIYNPAELAKRRLNAIDEKASEYVSMIESGISTGSEIVRRRHPDKYKKLFFVAMSDALSFLDYLEDQKRITKEEINGIWHYTTK